MAVSGANSFTLTDDQLRVVIRELIREQRREFERARKRHNIPPHLADDDDDDTDELEVDDFLEEEE